MTVRRGEVWYALLNPVRGSEQAGSRPVLIFQNNKINRVSTTTLAIPFTSNLRRSASPSWCARAKAAFPRTRFFSAISSESWTSRGWSV